jgi:hypothetical protein
MGGFLAFVDCGSAGHDDGCRRERRAAVSEGTDAGWTVLQRTAHRRASQYKRKGKNELGGAHSLSPSGFPALDYRVHSRASFPQFCATSEKWFRRFANCFVGTMRTKQFEQNINDFNRMKMRP